MSREKALPALGALTFSVLTVHYWRKTSSRRDPVFASFTLTCAAAFLINVMARMEPRWETPLAAALDLATGMVPPLLLHLVLGDRKHRLRVSCYAFSVAVAIALIVNDVSTVSMPFRDQAPAVLLAAAAGLGLMFVAGGDRLRLWYRLLLSLTVVVALAGLWFPSPIAELAPDYLLLAFFCVTLYYRERLIFFDLLIKRGVFFCFAVIAMALVLSAAHVPGRLTIILMLTPLWLVAPWADWALAFLVDRFFLRRRYSPADAERVVLGELQIASTEDDLRCRAERSLSEVFGGAVEVRFAWPLEPPDDDATVAVMEGLGGVILKPRASGIPYMTDDRRLLDSLAHTLGVVFENVRYREQQGRHQELEQQLRLLASRAELKALRAQINPHFLFNTLNAIAGLVPTQPQLADETVEQLAEVFRYTLRKSNNEWVRLDEEIEFIRAYLRIEQARFGARLNVQIDVDATAGLIPVPAMVVQPLIENAIKHGLPQSRGAISLRATSDNRELQIEVSDNGPGFPAGFSLAAPGNGHSHGLRNIADRLEGYYGKAAQLSWRNTLDGTRVLIRIPNDTNADRR